MPPEKIGREPRAYDFLGNIRATSSVMQRFQEWGRGNSSYTRGVPKDLSSSSTTFLQVPLHQ